MLLAGAAHAQGTELFFSEYDEGAHQTGTSYNGGVSLSTGSERAIEIYNPTTSAVNLNPYSIRRYSNGKIDPTEEERLFRSDDHQVAVGVNSLPSRSTFVVASGEATLPVIRNAANQFSVGHSPVTGPTVILGGGTVYFNGDDAMVLLRNPIGTAGSGPGIIEDLIGVIGEQPKAQSCATSTTATGNWSGTNPKDGATPVYVSSANQSLERRPEVMYGTRTSPLPQNTPGTCPPVRQAGGYNISDQWSVYSYAFPPGTTGSTAVGAQLYDRLGTHNDYTGPYGVYQSTVSATLAKFDANISVYPNPAHGTATVEIKDAKVGSVVVINSLGQRISAQGKGLGQEKLILDISGLKAGLYFVQIVSADGATKIYKELVVQ